ncbi:MAG: fumarate hydratase [Ruminococcaceae bacterium]|nr:fumarate hydratase [Oscillospiraceae bacterium]
MRIIDTSAIQKAVEELFIEANYTLPESLCNKISECQKNETDELASSVLTKLTDNIIASKQNTVPVCQDTGMAVLFVEIGDNVSLIGKSFEDAVNDGVRDAYVNGYMRKSIVVDPLFNRVNTNDNTPAIIHTRIVKGDTVKITAAPKGFGSENMSAVKMFTPSATPDDIVGFVVDTVRNAGGNPCPPIVVGVGIGGNFEYCTYLAKKALTRDVDVSNSDSNYANLEKVMLDRINELDIGPQGFGGKTTALAVNIETYPTHIAGLPVAVNIGCHVTRHASVII